MPAQEVFGDLEASRWTPWRPLAVSPIRPLSHLSGSVSRSGQRFDHEDGCKGSQVGSVRPVVVGLSTARAGIVGSRRSKVTADRDARRPVVEIG